MKRYHSKLQHLDLFSGIGGFSLGLEATGGFETKAFCDIEEYPRQVLQKHWPHVKQYKDIKELNYERLKADGINSIDIITGGYPCQPFSVAGRQKGEEDPRHLWPEYFRLVKELRPTWVIGENVSGHIKLGLDTVIEDLESEDYSVRPFSISASSIGANHQRERIWIMAYSERNYNFNKEQRVNGEEKEISREHREDNSTSWKSSRASAARTQSDSHVENSRRSQWPRAELQGENENETREGNANQHQRSSSSSRSDVANSDSEGLQRQWESRNKFGSFKSSYKSSDEGQGTMGQGWWESEPNVGRVAHGIPKRVDRLKSLGNSLVPQIPYYIGSVILKTMADPDID
ncbi:DNA (cytosine-5-)-methyltransferase [bacterium]|nr:DNA (cytosine-5-)-methyltransferase [bacterium]